MGFAVKSLFAVDPLLSYGGYWYFWKIYVHIDYNINILSGCTLAKHNANKTMSR